MKSMIKAPMLTFHHNLFNKCKCSINFFFLQLDLYISSPTLSLSFILRTSPLSNCLCSFYFSRSLDLIFLINILLKTHLSRKY
jgi:hypothetical protein